MIDNLTSVHVQLSRNDWIDFQALAKKRGYGSGVALLRKLIKAIIIGKIKI